MNTIRFAGKLARTKQAVDPSQVLTDRAFARDPLLYASSRLPRYDVIDKTVGAEVDRVLPQPLFKFLTFEPQSGAVECELKRFFTGGNLGGHIFIST